MTREELIEKYAQQIDRSNDQIETRGILTRFASELREQFVEELGEPRAWECFIVHKDGETDSALVFDEYAEFPTVQVMSRLPLYARPATALKAAGGGK